MAYKKQEEAVKASATSTVQEEKLELTKEQLDAIIEKKQKEVRQEIAMKEAKDLAEKALKEKAEAAQGKVMSDISTRQALNAEKKYKVIVYPAEGESQGGLGVININGVKFEFKYGEEVILPESALDILNNSKTFGAPKLVKDGDGAHYEPVKVQKRAYNSTPAREDAKLKIK
jgi:hypothetical protein